MEKDPIQIKSIQFTQFEEAEPRTRAYIVDEIEKLAELKIDVRALLGTRMATVGEVKEYKVGDILEVERMDGHHVDIYVGHEKVAYGEIVPMENNFGLEITEAIDKTGKFLKQVRKNGELG